jgi:hypothetical protein
MSGYAPNQGQWAADARQQEQQEYYASLQRVTSAGSSGSAGSGAEFVPPPLAGLVEEDSDEHFHNFLSKVVCSMLPGSVRLIFSATLPLGDNSDDAADPDARTGRLPGKMKTAAELARLLPASGMLGCSQVTVTAYDDKVTDNTARRTATIVDTATGRQLLSAPRTLTPAPAGVAVCSVAVLGLPLTVSGLSGNEKVHVFGQGMNPLSIIVPPNTANMRVTLPAVGLCTLNQVDP